LFSAVRFETAICCVAVYLFEVFSAQPFQGPPDFREYLPLLLDPGGQSAVLIVPGISPFVSG